MEQAGSLKKNDTIMINGHACKIASYAHSEPGKHGGSKVRFVTRHVFNPDKRVETFMPCHTMVEVPELVKHEMLCLKHATIIADTMALAASPSGDEAALAAVRFDGVCDEGHYKRVGLKPLTNAVAESIVTRMAKGDHVLIAVCTHGAHSAIMDARSAKVMSQVNSLKGPAAGAAATAAAGAEGGGSTAMSRKAQRKAKKAAKADAKAAKGTMSKTKAKGEAAEVKEAAVEAEVEA
mmetsp:Transcript_109725/g.319018  ORF Transcript_109725/g.319018 Transcript_109725/m.319018 type:complete len:236 (+) Transcript_109725:368-1075(+)